MIESTENTGSDDRDQHRSTMQCLEGPKQISEGKESRQSTEAGGIFGIRVLLNVCAMKQCFRIIVAAVLLAFGACQQYEAAPITPQTVNDGLSVPSNDQLNIEISKLKHPALQPVPIDFSSGLTPRQIAVIAVIVNPSLRAVRDQRAAADAQLLEAGILPNPQVSYDFAHPIGGGVTEGTANGFSLGFSWDVQELVSRDARVQSAKENVASVNLDIAWEEWRVAEAAEQAAEDLLSLQAQRQADQEVDQKLQDNLAIVRSAVQGHQKTILDETAALAASQDAHSTFLQAQSDEQHARQALNRAMGFPPDFQIKLRDDSGSVDSQFTLPSYEELNSGLEDRRLDLLALKRGYQSEEETLRAAILAQFPKINIGFNRATDTTNVHSIGFGVTADIPIFDRNQGTIATEKATRQRLFDEYVQRVFEARSDIATSLDDIRSLNLQLADAKAALPGLQRLVEVYQEAVDHGNADVLSYYNAQVDLAQKTITILKLKQQLADNLIALQIAAGQFFPLRSDAATRRSP